MSDKTIFIRSADKSSAIRVEDVARLAAEGFVGALMIHFAEVFGDVSNRGVSTE